MDEFLKIIYRNYAAEKGMYNDDRFNKELKNSIELFKKYLSKEISEDVYMSLVEDISEIKEIYFVLGMKLAIDIMNKKYIPTL